MARAKYKYFVEGFEGVQRTSDRVYTHAVIAIPDVVGRAEAMLAWEKGEQQLKNAKFTHAYAVQSVEAGVGGSFRPAGWTFDAKVTQQGFNDSQAHVAKYPSYQAAVGERIRQAEKDLADARERHAAGTVKAEVISFHSRRDLAEKARDALRSGPGRWLMVTVREVARLV